MTGVLKVPGTQTQYVDALPEKQIGGYPTDKQLHRAAVGRDLIDSEGRCLLLEFPLFVLINVYCPARRNHERTGYRNTFLLALDVRIRNLAAAGKNVVLCGDLNVMRDQIDTAGLWGHQGQKVVAEALEFDETYMTMRAPKMLSQLLFNSRTISDAGIPFIDEAVVKRRPPVLYDTCRELHPKRPGMYTCWNTQKNHRPANFGSRIDMIMCSPKLMQLVREADIQPHLQGSDHCSVYIVLRETVEDVDTGQGTHTLDYLNPPGRFADGQPALSTEEDTALLKRFPQSGRRLPLFSNRRHIASMFRQPSKPASPQEQQPVHPVTKGHSDSATTVQILPEPKLPDILKADVVEFVESDDEDGDAGIIEDDDLPETADYGEGPKPIQIPVSVSLPTDQENARNDGRESQPPPHTKDASQVTSLPSRATPAVSLFQSVEQQSGRPTAGERESSAVGGSESIDLHFERGDTPSSSSDGAFLDVEFKPQQFQSFWGSHHGNEDAEGARTGTGQTLLPSVQKSKAPPVTKRNTARSKSGAGSNTLPVLPSSASSSSSARPTKKAKTSTGTGTGSGFQTSMNMFLKTLDRTKDEPQKSSQEHPPEQLLPPPDQSRGTDAESSSSTVAAAAVDNEPPDDEVWMSAEEVDAAFKNMDAAKASWSRLGLGQRQAPMCEHGEPCKTFVTKKPGVNSGRSFYMCARPPGPLGKREKGTAWQCTTFVWCRGWKPDRPD